MNEIINGNEILIEAIKKLKIDLNSLIAETSIWVHPEICKELEIKKGITYFPNVRRGRHFEKKGEIINGVRIDDNTYANNAIKKAISINRKNIKEYYTCHIYSDTCYNEKYHTKLQNLVLIPSSIAQLSDNFPDVINSLKYRSFELYGWFPDESEKPKKPENYPSNWKEPINISKNYKVKNKPKIKKNDLNNEDIKNIEHIEIQKIINRIPRWFRKGRSQINGTILLTYMNLLDENGFVLKDKLMKYCGLSEKIFLQNFSQMCQFGEKNHGKVFDLINDEVRLWKPIKEIVLREYKKYN